MAQPKNISKREWKLRTEPDMMGLKYHFSSGMYDLQTLYNEPSKNTEVQEYNDWGVWRLARNLQEKKERYSLKEIIDILSFNKFSEK